MFGRFSLRLFVKRDRLAKMRHRLLERRTAQGVFARLGPPLDRQALGARRSEMASDRLRFRLSGDQRRCGAPVQGLTAASQEAVIGRVLNQRMLETVACLRRDTFDEQKRGIDEAGQSSLERSLVEPVTGGLCWSTLRHEEDHKRSCDPARRRSARLRAQAPAGRDARPAIVSRSAELLASPFARRARERAASPLR